MTWTSGQPIFSVDGLSSSAILGPGMQLSGGSTAFQQVRVSDAHRIPALYIPQVAHTHHTLYSQESGEIPCLILGF